MRATSFSMTSKSLNRQKFPTTFLGTQYSRYHVSSIFRMWSRRSIFHSPTRAILVRRVCACRSYRSHRRSFAPAASDVALMAYHLYTRTQMYFLMKSGKQSETRDFWLCLDCAEPANVLPTLLVIEIYNAYDVLSYANPCLCGIYLTIGVEHYLRWSCSEWFIAGS